MEQILYSFIENSSTLQKAVFLMIAGVLFVFAVQTIFYTIVKIWVRKKNEELEDKPSLR
jgi:Na+-transporting methylmalonyl-CoA/oxaloacetate decarboxylase gamma subunit